MRSAPPQHQHEPEDFILPRLFDSLGLTSNAKLFGEAQPSVGWEQGRGKDAANNNAYKDYPRREKKKNKGKTKVRGAGYNHLTIIARDGEVVAWGFNSFSSGPRASVHSEVAALRALFSCHDKAGRAGGGRGGRGGAHRSEGFDLVNVRFTFDSLRISRPCRRCWLFLSKHLWRFRRVMYTTSDGLVVCMSADEFASTPSDHVSKGHRPDYGYGNGAGVVAGGGGGGGASAGSSPRKKKKAVCGGVCSHMAARHTGCCC